jgi:hypothetical protein
MLEEFADAENLLLRAGLLETKMPIKVEAVMGYLAKDRLQLYGNGHEIPHSLLRGLKWPSPEG